MMKQEEADLIPGGVEMMVAAATMTFPVVFSAPATMASAAPSRTIMAPQRRGSPIISRALAGSTPLCFRSLWYSSAYSPSAGDAAGSTMEMPERSVPAASAALLMSPADPTRLTSLASFLSTIIRAACMVRDSVPSGRTSLLCIFRAFSCIISTNAMIPLLFFDVV